MPEIPDLEVIARFLGPRLREQQIRAVETRLPWLVRTGADELQTLVGRQLATVRRHGKFLIFATDDDRLLVVNAMLTGRFHWAAPADRRRPMTALVLSFEDEHQLRYSDQRRMGRWYLVAADALETVPQFAELGPDALTIEEDAFIERLKRHRGQIKNTLTNQRFICGIGNAYADEILWEAMIHPHCKRSTMDEAEQRRLYRAMRTVYGWAIPILEAELADDLYQRNEEWRAHLRAHRQAGEPCPRCGDAVKAQLRGGRETNYCLHCQPLVVE